MAAEPLAADPADAGDVPVRLLRALRADPGHAAEWAVLFAVQRLSAESGAYAARLRAAAPETSPDRLAERVRDRAEDICRIEGAISGTPFLVALVPAYIALLWEQARMADSSASSASSVKPSPSSSNTLRPLVNTRGAR